MWVVGNYVSSTEEGTVWDIIGIFDKAEKALDACTKPNHFIGEIKTNVRLPEKREEWPGLVYPLRGD